MKVYANQLNSHLKKGLTSSYLIAGEIPVLLQEAIESIEKEAQKQEFSTTLRYHIDQEFDWSALKNTLNHSSLFQEKQCILLLATTLHWGAQGDQVLTHFIENPQPDKLLILVTPKLDAKIQKAGWVKKITSKGTYVPVWPLDFSRYVQWLQAKFQEKACSIEMDAIRLLAEHTEGNYASAMQSVEKLALAYPKNRINADQVVSFILPARQFSGFDWIDECLKGNIRRMMMIFHSLKEEAVEPALMLWSITQELRKLIQVYIAMNLHSVSRSEAFKQQGIWEKKQPWFQKALDRHNIESLEALLECAYEADKILKGAKQGNIWDALISMGLQLTNAKSMAKY